LTALRLGTRGSALALAQARWAAERLGGSVEIVEITTAGDVDRAAGDKSRWTGALERALLDGEIDLAVHSAKDVPGELAEGTEIVAVPPRADPRDVLVGVSSLDGLPRGARVGTSALRRRAQLLAVRPDLEVVELRGNVDTRLRKLAAGEVDALVLAAAGLARLGRDDVVATALEGDVFVPAPGQGFLAVQARTGGRFESVGDRRARADSVDAPGSPLDAIDDRFESVDDPRARADSVDAPDSPLDAIDDRFESVDDPRARANSVDAAGSPLVALDDPSARVLLTAERDLVARLGASCHTPVGAHARATAAGIAIRAFVGLPDGSEWLIDEATDADVLAERLLSAGAADLLARAEAMA